jgi:hypothetical protein
MKTRACFEGMRLLGLFPLLLAGCDSGEAASKSWSALATCLAGPAVGAPVIERAQKIRQYQLANPNSTAKDGWPSKCNASADDLYAALDTSGKPGLFRRKLQQRLSCNDQKGSCKVPTDGTLISSATELWESAKSAELNTTVAAGVAPPPEAPAPVVDSKGWKSFSAKPLRLSGPVLTSDGRAIVVLKAAEGRSRPVGCEFAPGFAKVRCLAENPKVPELPPQSIEAVSDAKGVYAAGLTDTGLVAYNLETGETSPVGGRAGRLVREGAVVDRAGAPDITDTPSEPGKSGLPGKPGKSGKAAKSAKPAKSGLPGKGQAAGGAPDEGFVVRELSGNKASKDIPLPKSLVGEPRAVGNQVLSLSVGELVTLSVKGGRVSAPTTLKGVFTGSIHTCQREGVLGVAIFGGRKDQGMAKPTVGEDKTAVTVTLYKNGAWSKPAEATIPFDRATDSDLVCTASGASLVWAKKGDGGATVGRVDCNADTCVTGEAKLAGVEPIYFWTASPIGLKTMLLYRGALGETRLRVAGLAELPNAKDSIVFDTADFGGPTTGELLPAFTDEAALLLFRGEQPPVALRVGGDGAVSVVTL